MSQRSHELGVRLALGATGRRLASMVVGEGLSLTIAGLVIGIAVAAAVSRVIDSLLFGVTALDPLTIGAVLAVLLAVAALASYIPARRAARIDPLAALRGH